MSWLSKALGLDSHPAELKAINQVGAIVLSGVESSNPVASSLINVLTTIGNNIPTTPISAASAAGTIVVALDPNVVNQIESAINAVLEKAGVSILEKTIDDLLVEELQKLGITKPATSA